MNEQELESTIRGAIYWIGSLVLLVVVVLPLVFHPCCP
jgi:hypothetical protein